MPGSPSRAVRVALVIGAVPFVWALLFGLRWAHLLRQRSGEGVAFASVGVAMAGGAGVLVLAAIMWLVQSGSMPMGQRRIARMAAGTVILIVIAGSLTALWVAEQGNACIGRCGPWF